jgi:hypothetical protein
MPGRTRFLEHLVTADRASFAWAPLRSGRDARFIALATMMFVRKSGYEVRKNDNGQWEVRFMRTEKSGWPALSPSPCSFPAA